MSQPEQPFQRAVTDVEFHRGLVLGRALPPEKVLDLSRSGIHPIYRVLPAMLSKVPGDKPERAKFAYELRPQVHLEDLVLGGARLSIKARVDHIKFTDSHTIERGALFTHEGLLVPKKDRPEWRKTHDLGLVVGYFVTPSYSEKANFFLGSTKRELANDMATRALFPVVPSVMLKRAA